MSQPHIPMSFASLTIQQIQNVYDKAIRNHNNELRFTLMKAAKGDQAAQQQVIATLKKDPTWIDRIA